jgi:hypothetical protein
VRERYPRWGKDKLAVLLRRAGIVLSVSMIGRILSRLRRSGELREPTRRRMGVRQRRWQRPYAIRRPADWAVERPGDLVELDTLDIRPLSTLVLKQFTARDVVSRWDTVELGRRATAIAAAAVLDRLAERMPFPVRAISIDNGSEFMAEFETACEARGIRRSSRARSSAPTGPTPRSSTRSRPPSPISPRSRRSCGSGRRCTTRSAPTRHSAIGHRPNTWPPSASRCNGRTGRVQLVDTGAAEPYRPRHAHASLLLLSTPGMTDLGA